MQKEQTEMAAVYGVELLVAFEIVLDSAIFKICLNFQRGLKVAERIKVVNEPPSFFVGAPVSSSQTGVGTVQIYYPRLVFPRSSGGKFVSHVNSAEKGNPF